MPYSSPELLQLQAIQSWMATLTVWQEWVDSTDETTLKAAIVWPLKAAPTLPVCVLSISQSIVRNMTGAAGGANFQPSGEIKLWIYAADTQPTDPQTGYSDFLDLLCRLRDEMADNAHVAPVLFNEFQLGMPPVVHSRWINAEDDDTGEGLGDYYQGELSIRWGVET